MCILSSKSAAPGPNWLKIRENVVRTFPDKTVSTNSDYSSHKKVMPFFRGQIYFFPFLTLSTCKKNNKRTCQKFETRFLRSMCEETDAMLIIFSSLNLAGIYFDLWVCEAL